jgi:chemotaxis protein MotB
MNTRPLLYSSLVIVSALASAACGVSQVTYDQAVRDAAVARAEAEQAKADARRAIGTSAGAAEFQKQATELEDLREKLTDANARVATIQSAEEAARAKAALYQELATQLHNMVDAGQLSIVLRDGRMVLQLPNDVLFDTGKTELKPGGRATLKKIADVLATLHERHFQIAGHTDDKPISTARFPSNWELSTQRAVEVVHYLVAQGVKQDALSAAGYADVDPVAPNSTTEGRAKNRRTEITVQPNIDEFVRVPHE